MLFAIKKINKLFNAKPNIFNISLNTISLNYYPNNFISKFNKWLNKVVIQVFFLFLFSMFYLIEILENGRISGWCK